MEEVEKQTRRESSGAMLLPRRQSGRGLPAASLSWGAGTPYQTWSMYPVTVHCGLVMMRPSVSEGGSPPGSGLLHRECSSSVPCGTVFARRRRGERRFKPCGEERKTTAYYAQNALVALVACGQVAVAGGLRQGAEVPSLWTRSGTC